MAAWELYPLFVSFPSVLFLYSLVCLCGRPLYMYNFIVSVGTRDEHATRTFPGSMRAVDRGGFILIAI